MQETFFEAHRDFPQFRGESSAQFLAWLRRIVVNNILRAVEQHVLTDKCVCREISLAHVEKQLEQSTVCLETLLVAGGELPSTDVLRREREIQLADSALSELPADYRNIIMLRHIQGLSFEEVAARMERSSAPCA